MIPENTEEHFNGMTYSDRMPKYHNITIPLPSPNKHKGTIHELISHSTGILYCILNTFYKITVLLEYLSGILACSQKFLWKNFTTPLHCNETNFSDERKQ